jgi:hypothetical protein
LGDSSRLRCLVGSESHAPEARPPRGARPTDRPRRDRAACYAPAIPGAFAAAAAFSMAAERSILMAV